MAPHVNVDPAELIARTRRELLRLLESIRGKKNLVIQKTLLGPLGLITKFSTLQEYGIEKLFVLENRNVDTNEKNIVFLSHAEQPKEIQAVAESIKQIRRESQGEHDFSIIWVPRRTLISDRILEEHGVLGEANILACPLFFTALAPDLLSLEVEDAASDLYLRHDPTAIFLSAQALMTIQRRSGLVPRILGKGDNAKRLAELLLRLRAEEDITSSASSISQHLTGFGTIPSAAIDTLIIIDRDIDLPTPLLTQLTYAGLLDESYGIQYNTLEAPTSVVGAVSAPSQNSSTAVPAPAAQKRKIQLDQSDALYPSLQDINFALLGPTLNIRARALMSNYEARHKQDASISDLKSFVQKLPSYQAEQASLKIHTGLAEDILRQTRTDIFSTTLEVQQTLVAAGDGNSSAMLDKIEDLIGRAIPLSSILRLLSLASMILGGLRARDLDRFRTLVTQGYGYQHMLTLSRLETMGLLTQRQGLNTAYLNPMASASAATSTIRETNGTSGSSPPSRRQTDYGHVRRALRLLVDDVDEAAQADIAYAFSGYAPLSVRIVQCALQKSWQAAVDRPPAAAQEGTTSTTTAAAQGAAGKDHSPSTHVASQGWKGFEDVLSRVKGATVDVQQLGADEGAAAARVTLKGSSATAAAAVSASAANTPLVGTGTNPFGASSSSPLIPSGPGASQASAGKTVTSIVFFLGGITWAEVAALRLVGRKMREARGGENRRLLIVTTGMINGNSLVGGAIEQLNFG